MPDLMNDNLEPLPIQIKFPRVGKPGETIVYKLPSAYPQLPLPTFSSGIGKPMYFQFHSTAVLNKNRGPIIVFFEKEYIDANFPNPDKIKAFYFNNGNWNNQPLSTNVVKRGKKDFYKVRYPAERRVTGLVAFGEDAAVVL
jgi:hypothetical protein